MRGKFSLLYVHIRFDMAKCNFIVKNSSFKMLVLFSPVSVADTKIAFVYNFLAPLTFKRLGGGEGGMRGIDPPSCGFPKNVSS